MSILNAENRWAKEGERKGTGKKKRKKHQSKTGSSTESKKAMKETGTDTFNEGESKGSEKPLDKGKAPSYYAASPFPSHSMYPASPTPSMLPLWFPYQSSVLHSKSPPSNCPNPKCVRKHTKCPQRWLNFPQGPPPTQTVSTAPIQQAPCRLCIHLGNVTQITSVMVVHLYHYITFHSTRLQRWSTLQQWLSSGNHKWTPTVPHLALSDIAMA